MSLPEVVPVLTDAIKIVKVVGDFFISVADVFT
jgi:hypothetical protein